MKKSIATILMALFVTSTVAFAAPKLPPAESCTKTSIISPDTIQVSDDVWGSGSSLVDNGDGTYTSTLAKAGAGSWGGEIGAIPFIFDAGTLAGCSYLELEIDTTNVKFKNVSEDYPAYDVKLLYDGPNGEVNKMFNCVKLNKDGKVVLPINKCNFLPKVTKIIIEMRGTGTAIIKDVSKLQ